MKSKMQVAMVTSELDMRDHWMGIRKLRKGFQHVPYTMKTENGKRARYGDRAKEAAKFLGDHIWGNAPDDFDAPKADKVVPDEVPCLTTPVHARCARLHMKGTET